MNNSKDICKYIFPRGPNKDTRCNKLATIEGYCQLCYSKPGRLTYYNNNPDLLKNQPSASVTIGEKDNKKCFCYK